ncbi:KAP family NTPase [Acinetobacter baumannii]|uniref:KAP family NTPase n=1 Tax=Acinetobacter baumannii TaxID=470 RepID=UPI0022267F24|nr:KAP family NTPase [Acinetobacter baumannii]
MNLTVVSQNLRFVLLNASNIFFDIPKVVFILAINKTQLEESINNFYGFSNTANYLEKFIDFSIMLKSRDLDGNRYSEILKN